MQDSEARTTETSEAEGRLKVDVGRCRHGKKGKCLRCVVKGAKDGSGGPGTPEPRGLRSNPLIPPVVKTAAVKPTTPASLPKYESLTRRKSKGMISVSLPKIKKLKMKSLKSALNSLKSRKKRKGLW